MKDTEFFELSEKTKIVSVIGADTYLGAHMVEHLVNAGKTVLGFTQDMDFDFSQEPAFQKETEKLPYPADAIISESIYLCLNPNIGFEKYSEKIKKICNACLEKEYFGNVCYFSCASAYLSRFAEITEENVVAPQTERDLALVTGENLLNVMLYDKKNYAVPVIFRIGTSYGNELKNVDDFGFVNMFISSASQRKNINIPFFADAKRTLINIGDICESVIAITEKATAPLTVNIPGETLTIRQVATAIAEHYGVSLKINECLASENQYFDAGDLQLSDKYFNENAQYSRKWSFIEWLSTQNKNQVVTIG